MIFNASNAIGKAGEHYFAYWICVNFDWACRLLDIDIGIDAQIEIFDKNHKSTGNFINVQVKATKSNKYNGTATRNNLTYWKTIEEPTIVVQIRYVNGEIDMRWKLMTEDICNEHLERLEQLSDKTKGVTISFDDAKILAISDKYELETLHIKKQLVDYKTKYQELINLYRELDIQNINSVSVDYMNDYWSNFLGEADMGILEYAVIYGDKGVTLAKEMKLLKKQVRQLSNYLDVSVNENTHEKIFTMLLEGLTARLYRIGCYETTQSVHSSAKEHYPEAWKVLDPDS
ncbi:hypothetical protein A145_05785 [Vibrio splendidus 5S-101]|uniref:DUF4365 domain-containing protein n=1 Tax=Vibrio splendidus TaxID=29497 RepID=UPI0002F858E6|nr:DUF4365 domain-containing protein [Vibrio splendidus]OEF21220.1 hypothetical protein A145_05785 [Vibrio splendidus 5S-101]